MKKTISSRQKIMIDQLALITRKCQEEILKKRVESLAHGKSFWEKIKLVFKI